MGMFDYLYIHDPEVAARVVCAQGHQACAASGFQTKDGNCTMASYYIFNGHLHRVASAWMADETLSTPQPPPPGDPVNYTGHIRFYGYCPECPRTLWEHSRYEQKFISAAQPRCHYVALFIKGKLVHVEPMTLETPDEVVAEMEGHGYIQVDSKGNPLASQI